MERRIAFEGISNFRDLGGYQTNNGESVKWRTIFRSDTLSSLTDADVETVCDLGVNAVFDLRYGEERTAEPSRFIGHDEVELLEMGLDERPDTRSLDSFENATDVAATAKAWMMEGYRNYPFLYADAYRTMVQRLTAGKTSFCFCLAANNKVAIL